MASNTTQADFLQKSKFKVFVPKEPALRFSPTDFNEYVSKLIKRRDQPQRLAEVQTQDPAVPSGQSTENNEAVTDDSDTLCKSSLHSPKPADITGHPFVDAMSTEMARKRRHSASDLKENQMRTENNDIAFKSTESPLVDLFTELEDVVSTDRLTGLLDSAWKEDPLATLKLIWNARSIHLGKSERKTFYRCCGYLADEHPLTLLRNLPWVVRPIIAKKVVTKDGKADEDDNFEMVGFDDLSLEEDGNVARFDVENGVAHGYWKDLLNILALVANDKIHSHQDITSMLNSNGGEKVKPHKRVWDQAEAKKLRDKKAADRYGRIQSEFADTKAGLYKALHLTVARLFGDQLSRDLKLLEAKKYRDLSLAAKWAPSQKGFHDKQTLIVSSIAEYLFPREDVVPKDVEADRELYLKYAREAYRIKVASPLRKALEVVERDITEGKFSRIKYNRVPSLAMNNYSSHFIEKDHERFASYIESVAHGKTRISGATLLPSTLVSKAMDGERGGLGLKGSKNAKQMIANATAQLEANVVDAQWNTLVQRIKDSGKIENSIAVCDVSGSMGHPVFKDSTCPFHSSLGLSLLLAEVTQPPFGGYFITFSAKPEIQKVGGPDDKRTLKEKLNQMSDSQWTMNTNFVAVFEDLILPMALDNNIKQEDMVKQVFVFSDMHFDQCGGGSKWTTSYERIKHKFTQAGYEMPQLIFWNLAGGKGNYGMHVVSNGDSDDEEIAPKPATAEEPGVAFVSGYSQGQMKMFLENAQFEDEDVVEKVEGETVVVRKEKKKIDGVALMRKAIGHRSYGMLKVVD